MKTLRQLFAVIVLTLMIAVSSFAGDMHTTDDPPSPPSAPAKAAGEMTTGDGGTIHTTNADEATAGDAVVAGALELMQVVLSLL